MSQRAVAAIERTAAGATTPAELFEGLSAQLAKSVPHDASMVFGVDPSTLLAVAPARIQGIDSGYCQAFWHLEFHEPDVLQFHDLARAAEPAASLQSVTDGRPVRSARYRDFLQPQGYGDELRAVFRTGQSTWAVLGLYRERSREPFSRQDVAILAAVSDVIASAYRARAALAAPAMAPMTSPGLLVFDARGVLVSANAEATRWLGAIYGSRSPGEDAEAWLQLLADPDANDLQTPFPIIPLLERARAVATGHETAPARLRLRDATGRWVVLHASSLDGPAGAGTIGVVVEPAKSTDIAPIVIQAFGLTPRERDVVQAIARGLSTPEIAAELFLSRHTVRDYIKSVFEKLGVSSRGELVAKLFADHYSESVHATAIHVN